ncbi:MAG TPA: DNA polymerase I, partial [Gammaproteobacteria bacterium]|nr:DNA polymerase I [Gammaproteobacteria bacterium]
PNLQNIPIRTEDGRRVRKAFIAPEGWSVVAADYSQIELRIMAHLSEDPGLVDAFARGEDIHRATASEVFTVEPMFVTSEQRRRAKAINFGLIYGMSAFGLARQLGIERAEAATYIDRYFERYPGVRRYMDSTRTMVHEQGYVETVFGRRLTLPDIRAKQVPVRQAAERAAINAPMQGTAADIIKRAMLRVQSALKSTDIGCQLLLQVHDELVFEVIDQDLAEARDLIRTEMELAAELSVPLVVQIGNGGSWFEAH